MNATLDPSIAILVRTPDALKVVIRDLPEDWIHFREGPETWSLIEIVAHLVYSEQVNWVPRIKTVLEYGVTRAFIPFDRLGHMDLVKQNTLSQLLGTFEDLRAENVAFLRGLGLTPVDLLVEGLHPELGSVTLGQLIASWSVHDLNHLRQVVEVMARRRKEDVGPWRTFLPIVG